MAHTSGPWKVDLDQEFIQDGDDVTIDAVTEDGKYVRREIAICLLDTGENKDGEDWEEDSGNARLIVAACNSYDRHCGANAVQCAEEDLLGQALEALQEVLHHACSPEDEEYAWKYYDARDKALAVLEKAKGE